MRLTQAYLVQIYKKRLNARKKPKKFTNFAAYANKNLSKPRPALNLTSSPAAFQSLLRFYCRNIFSAVFNLQFPHEINISHIYTYRLVIVFLRR